jgi:hypothetical protein
MSLFVLDTDMVSLFQRGGKREQMRGGSAIILSRLS